MTLTVAGVDPGPSSGFAVACWADGKLQSAHALQCDSGTALDALHFLLSVYGPVTCGGIEAFLPGAHSGRAEGSLTRRMVTELTGIAAGYDLDLKARSASTVKLWATDKRLEKAGLLALTPGSTHARDATRHVLYSAVIDGGLPDPLSRKART